MAQLYRAKKLYDAKYQSTISRYCTKAFVLLKILSETLGAKLYIIVVSMIIQFSNTWWIQV